MAKLIIEFDVPGWTVDELRKAVHDLDELEDPGNGIAPEYVKASDVLVSVYMGDLGLVEGEMTALVVKGLKANGIDIPFEPDTKNYFYTVKDVIEP